MVGVLFEGVMVMVREVRKDKLKANFDNKGGDNETDIGFDIKVPNEVNDS